MALMRRGLMTMAMATLLSVPAISTESAADVKTTTSKGICKAGFATGNDAQAPPGGTGYGSNKPILAVTMNKPCKGAVAARFTANVVARYDNQQMFAGIYAKCRGDGGHAGGCTKGEVVIRSPEGDNVARGPNAVGTYSQEAVFPNLKPGKWRFMVRLGGNNDAVVRYRSFTVKAYKGG